MSDWVRVCERAELLPGEYRVVDVDGVVYTRDDRWD